MENHQTRPTSDPGPGASSRDPGPGASPRDPDPAALLLLFDALRIAAPPELQDRLTALLREALLTLRSLIDWYLERLDDEHQPRTVEDIPID